VARSRNCHQGKHTVEVHMQISGWEPLLPNSSPHLAAGLPHEVKAPHPPTHLLLTSCCYGPHQHVIVVGCMCPNRRRRHQLQAVADDELNTVQCLSACAHPPICVRSGNFMQSRYMLSCREQCRQAPEMNSSCGAC
jgi:hypothetical protein